MEHCEEKDKPISSGILRYQLTRVAVFIAEKADLVDWGIHLNIGDVCVSFVDISNVARRCMQAKAQTIFEAQGIDGYNDSVVASARQRAEHALLVARDILSVQTAAAVRIESCPPFFSISWPAGATPNIIGNWQNTEHLGDFDVHLPTISSSGDLNFLADRLSGLSLFSQAVGGDKGIGTFLNFLRLFENAFAMSCAELSRGCLAQFLSSGPLLYELEEVRTWAGLRDQSAHADLRRSVTIAYDGDVARLIPRIKQAALDVLINKAAWQSKDTGRRAIWNPTTRIGENRNMALSEGVHTDVLTSILDPFTGWPVAADCICTPSGDCIAPVHNPRILFNIV